MQSDEQLQHTRRSSSLKQSNPQVVQQQRGKASQGAVVEEQQRQEEGVEVAGQGAAVEVVVLTVSGNSCKVRGGVAGVHVCLDGLQ